MTQNTEQNVRTVREQDCQVQEMHADMVKAVCGRRSDYPEEVFRAYLKRHIVQAETRGAEEQRRKDAEGCERWEFEEPEYHDQGMGCGLEDRGIHDRYQAMEYGWDQAVERCIERIPEELYTRPANIAALEAEIASLKEAEQLARADAKASKARVMELAAVLDGIKTYSEDTLAGPVGGGGDISWFKDGVEEAFRRARAALTREGGV